MPRGPSKNKKTKPEFSIDNVLNDENLLKQLEGFIEEVVISQQKVSQEKEALKDIKNEAKDSMGIPPKMLMKLVRLKSGESSLEGAEKELEELRQLLEAITA
jgi:uncharacterized protein (UPF0335 family)